MREWLIPVAVGEFHKKLQNGAAAIDKRRLLEVWIGYDLRDDFGKRRDPAVETLEAFVKHAKPHFPKKKDWILVKKVIRDLLMEKVRQEHPSASHPKETWADL